mmetsp:Transcript_7768/g.11651  ORF Transcript_7768/g.11651 Transcript_7768/m.11651 type:complete len:285 (+) Transcript_7768:103-957(+)
MKQVELEYNYERADNWCKGVVKKGHDLLFCGDRYDTEISKAAKDVNFSIDSLSSFLRNMHLTYVKKRSYVIRNQMHSHILVEYCEGASILSLAKKYNFPPSLLARGIVENITIFEKKEVTKAMKDPFVKLSALEHIFGPFRASEDAIQSENAEPLVDPFSGAPLECPIHASRLAREVVEATNSDPLYGPRVEKERNYVGIEYEIILERALRSMNIPFETEEQLRAKGSSRTPDILFSCPVALKVHKKLLSDSRHGAENMMVDEVDSNYVWRMVCWIDSKVWMDT